MMPSIVPRDIVSLTPLERRVTTVIDAALVTGAGAVILAWILGYPILYTSSAPVMSPFTAFSLLVLALVRQARVHADDSRTPVWPGNTRCYSRNRVFPSRSLPAAESVRPPSCRSMANLNEFCP